MQVSVTSNAGEIAARLNTRAAALRDLKPALKDIAAEIDLRTARTFQSQKSTDGAAWPGLAMSTKIARLKRRKTAYRKAVTGPAKKLGLDSRRNLYARQAAKLQRARLAEAAANAAGFKPLMDTGRLRGSANARVVGKDAVRWSIIGYAAPHITGSKNGKLPQRNMSVFRATGGGFVLDANMATWARERLHRHLYPAGGGR